MRKRIKDYSDGNTLILFTKKTGEGIIKDISQLADGYCNFLIYSTDEIIRSRIIRETETAAELAEVLKKNASKIDEVVFMGFHTDRAVIANALMVRGILPNSKIVVDASCCAGTTLDGHLAALEIMKNCQVNVIY
jgi:hypothetical protein